MTSRHASCFADGVSDSRAQQDVPAVSVITAAYNAERFLEDSATSVLRQTFTNFELIIVDDGSTDGTARVAEQIRSSDPQRVRVLRRENGGVSAARNAAFAVARGEFFAILDSDDLWEPQFLERQLAILADDASVDLVSGNGRYLGGRYHGLPVGPWPDTRPPIGLPTIIADEQAVFVMTVFRRRVYDTIGGLDEALRTNEDFDFWLRASLAGFRFVRNAEPLAWYRKRPGSLSADPIRMLSGALRVCAKVRASLADRPERGLLDRQIAYYQTELDTARAREALEHGDIETAVAALSALHARRPTVRTAIAAFLARRCSRLLVALYRLQLRARYPRLGGVRQAHGT